MKSTMKRVINVCMMLSCVLLLFSQTQVEAVESTAPVLQIVDYSIDEGALTPGGTVTINLSISNTSSRMEATDAVLTMGSETGFVYPIYGDDNQIVIGSIGAGQTVNTSIKMNVSKYFNAEVVAIDCNFSYLVAGQMAGNQVKIAIPSTTGYSLNISSIKLAERATVGAKSLINFQITNISSSEIKDAVLVVYGNVDEKTQSIPLGTIAANKEYLKDYYVSFNTVGDQEVILTLNYTDANGDYISIDEGKYTVKVDKASDVSNVTIKGSSMIANIGYIVAGVSCLIVLIIVIIYIKKHI